MSERINELIIHVKEYLNMGDMQSEKSIKDIENKIDDKNLQIRDIFARNLSQVINHYIQYQDISSNQRRLENHCEEFSKRIEKAQNLSFYDEQMIQRGEKAIGTLRTKKKQLQAMRESVRLLKKAAISIQQERYSNAIKQLNIYRENQPTIDTPLKKTSKIFNEKIKSHLNTLVNTFWEVNQPKMLDIGSHCYSKVELSTNEKTNIYQAFFGRNSTIRNSIIRKSSIIDQGKGEAPLRFLKKIKDQEILQKFILRINVEMNSLKQTRILCKEMKEPELFESILNKSIRKVVNDISISISCENENDLRKLLSNYIGFLLFRRQIIAFFNLEKQNKELFAFMYSLIASQTKSFATRPENISQIMKIKGLLDIFHKVLEIVDLDPKLTQYSVVLGQIFKIYCSFSLQQYESILGEQINQDNLMGYKAESQYEQKQIEQILKIKPPARSEPYNFTKFVIYVLHIFNQYYDRMVAFVKDSELNKSQIHDHLSALFERIITVYGGLLVVKDQPLQIAQGQVNLHYCETIFRYFSDQLEIKHQYMRMSEFSYKAKLETVIVELRRRMRQVVEQKIGALMSNYEISTTWLPENINKYENSFIQWTLQYVKSSIYELERTNNPAYEQMAYSWIGYIAQIYWECFQECKQFNLLTIYNLDVDLIFIFKYLKSRFKFYPQLIEKFEGLRQFYDLLLVNNMQDILDKNKRDITYSRLDLNRIIPILRKYNKAKHNAGGLIRDVKKKDVENLVKRLEVQR